MWKPLIRSRLLLLTIAAAAISTPATAEPFHYPAARHGAGELGYVQGVPVLLVVGTPAEMGEQVGVLAVKPAAALVGAAEEFLRTRGLAATYPVLLKMGSFMLPQFPPDHLAELEAEAKASSLPRDLFVFGNTASDLLKVGGCATLVVEPGRSATGGPLFGRNFDWPPFANLHEYTLATVYRGRGKHAFLSIGYPVMIGCASGINDAGLALAMLEVNSANDDSSRFSPAGTPTLLLLRRILEECTTVGEAEKLIRSVKRTTTYNIALCDKREGVVLEITAKTVMVRRAEQGICLCTNHFRTPELTTSTVCGRYSMLEKTRDFKLLTLDDVARQMHAVNQGPMTIQTMVFEPAALKLHLAYGEGPASGLPLKPLDLAKLLRDGLQDDVKP